MYGWPDSRCWQWHPIGDRCPDRRPAHGHSEKETDRNTHYALFAAFCHYWELCVEHPLVPRKSVSMQDSAGKSSTPPVPPRSGPCSSTSTAPQAPEGNECGCRVTIGNEANKLDTH
jgi:hypothetical protein